MTRVSAAKPRAAQVLSPAAPQVAEPQMAEAQTDETRHVVLLRDGQFTQAACSCGWLGAARRSRDTARDEARDHLVLYAPATNRNN